MFFVGIVIGGLTIIYLLAFLIIDIYVLLFKKDIVSEDRKAFKRHIIWFIVIALILYICIAGLFCIKNSIYEVKEEKNRFSVVSIDSGIYYYKVDDKYKAISITDENVSICVQSNCKPVICEYVIYTKPKMNKVLVAILSLGEFNNKRIEYEVVLPKEP